MPATQVLDATLALSFSGAHLRCSADRSSDQSWLALTADHSEHMTAAIQSEVEAPFPIPPIEATGHLSPIMSWRDMHREATDMTVEFDLFWYESVTEGVAYFFRWVSEPRCTVLVVWDDTGPTHVECRKRGDVLASASESAPILAAVVSAFRAAGHWRKQAAH